MNTKISLPADRKVTIAQSCFITLFFILMLYTTYNGNHTDFIFRQLFYPASAAFAGMLFMRPKLLKDNTEIKILLCYVSWIAIASVVSTFLTGATFSYYYEQTTYVTLFSSLVCYPLPFLFSGKEERRQSLNVILTVCITVYLAICLLAIALVLLGISIPSVTSVYTMGIHTGMDRLTMFMHANGVGSIGNLTSLLAVYMALSSRRAVSKVYFILAALVIYTTVGLADSRTNMVAIALALGLLAFLAVWRKTRDKKIIVSIAAGTVCAAAVTAIGYIGFGLMNDLVKAFIITPAAAEAAVTESRSLAQDITSFTGRTTIWKECLSVVFGDWRVLLFGTTQNRIMQYMGHLPHIGGNMHNALLQVLISAGLPALILIIVFLVYVVKACFKLFFARKKTPTLAEQFLPAIVFSGLLYSTMEGTLLLVSGATGSLTNTLFLLAAGMAVCASRDLSVRKV